MALPGLDVKLQYPASLKGQNNGRLVLSVLRQTPGMNGGPTVTLTETATRCWRALCAAAEDDNLVLQITSAADSYRPYAVQQAIFKQRYSPTPIPGRPTKTCNGITYWQKPNTATAACPGTSNHGWGLACDIKDATGKRLTWLLANAPRFGFVWELSSEAWHIRNVTGDAIPRAVLDYEEADPLAGITDKDAQALIWRVEAILNNRATVAGGPTQGEKNYLHDCLAAIGADLEAPPFDPAQLAAFTKAVSDAAEAGAEKGAGEAIDGATIHVGD